MPGSETPTAQRYICIHGHFYQPPRENPWLETVETQDSAAPYHDWNERVTAECYAPNGAARILNDKQRIIRILNNYGRISFNFGPTLLSWIEDNANRVYRMILDADENSRKRFGGHGSAVAQAYNHIIMPLAGTRDRITQIKWGLADFEHRFQRKPEGMWLPETAVDTESLELLAAEGIKFVILAPHQCARVRPLERRSAVQLSLEGSGRPEEEGWRDTSDRSVDTTRAYLVQLKDNRSIAAFFYDGPTSQAIAFGGLLNDGSVFAQRLMDGFSDNADHAQLVHIATDGETYGHHHRFGEMALAFALRKIEDEGQAQLTNYGEFLEKFPPEYEAQIAENTSWSCAHGVERWRSNCGCNGGRAGWNQEWRTPLRDALDGVCDTVAPLVQKKARNYFRNLDEARNAYIQVILNRDATDEFLTAQATHALSPEERVAALELMELERHAMLMYTSCGWFFDDISGIETVQIIAYAGRVLHLAGKLFGKEAAALEKQFLTKLAEAKSNVPEQGDGAQIYKRYVLPERINLEQVAAHYAISAVFTPYGNSTRLFCYTVKRLEHEIVTSGRGRLLIGEANVCSNITNENETVAFAVLHFGDQNITAVVKPQGEGPSPDDVKARDAFLNETRAAMIAADLPEVIRAFDRHFPGAAYSVRSLFRDEQRRIVDMILKSTLAEVEATFAAIYQNQASLLHFLSQNGLPRPESLNLAAGFAVNAGLREAIESEPINALQARAYLDLAQSDQVALNVPQLSYLSDQKMKRAMVELQTEVAAQAEQVTTLENALLVARTLNELQFDLNLWQAQNIWYDVWLRSPQPAVAEPEEWLKGFHELGELMRISVDDLVMDE